MTKKRFQLDLPVEMKADLEKLAEQQGRPVCDMVKEGVIAILQRYSRGKY